MNSRRPDPHLFVVFGGTGDLMRRKILPSLWSLIRRGLFDEASRVLAISISPGMDEERYRSIVVDSLKETGEADAVGAWAAKCVHYHQLPTYDDPEMRILGHRIESIEREAGVGGNRIFYLALPPQVFPHAINALGCCGLNKSKGWTRIVIEKPFGRDLESAQELDRSVHAHFEEEQVYRIDHYLGKGTVQNLLAFRFGNALFEPVWNRDRVKHVQVMVSEDLGIERRAAYYEQAGVVRDMLQNHLTQLLTLTAMEVPAGLDAQAIRTEKVKVLRSILPIRDEDVVLGQYANGVVGGKPVPGYRSEQGVAPDSATPTFVGLKLAIDNWRWHDVPFYLRTGKRLPSRVTQIVITFHRPPVMLFRPLDNFEMHSNTLVLTMQPDEGFDLSFEVRSPGQPFQLETHRMRFRYEGEFPMAYETLLLDLMRGDQTLFVHTEEVEASWRLYSPILRRTIPVQPYAAGTWGPSASDPLLGSVEPLWTKPEAR